MTEQETHTQWGVQWPGKGMVAFDSRDEARRCSFDGIPILSRQVTDWIPVEKPARMVKPTEFGSMVEASTEWCGRVPWVRVGGIWVNNNGQWSYWDGLVEPRPYTPGGAS